MRKLQVVLILLLVLTIPCLGAIAYDSSVDLGNNGGSTNSLSGLFNNVAGTTMAVCLVGDSFGGNDDITGITYNGASLSFVDKIVSGVTSPNRFVYLYVLNNPSTGSHSVLINATNSHYLIAGAASWSGTATAGQPDVHTPSISTAASSSYASSLTTSANNSWVALCEGGYDGGTAPVAGTGSTRRTYDATFGIWGIFDSNSDVTPAGSYSMTTTYTGGVNPIVHLMFSLKPPTSISGHCASCDLSIQVEQPY